MRGLVTSRRAVAAASCVASLATRVLRCTCTPRYSTDKTTAIEPTNCEIALMASQFMPVLYHMRMTGRYFGSLATLRTFTPSFHPVEGGGTGNAGDKIGKNSGGIKPAHTS